MNLTTPGHSIFAVFPYNQMAEMTIPAVSVLPFSTCVSAITIEDSTGSPVTNARVACVVTMPAATLTVTGLLNGNSYQATYNTEGPGAYTETWTATDAFGNQFVAQRHRYVAW